MASQDLPNGDRQQQRQRRDGVQYLAYCGCYLGEVQDIIDLCRLAEHEHGYWLNAHGQHLEDSVRSLIYHESTANASISYEPQVVMHEQLITLVLIGSVPHLTIRVVPASARFGGAFRLLLFAKHNPLVYLDTPFAGLFLEDSEFVDR